VNSEDDVMAECGRAGEVEDCEADVVGGEMRVAVVDVAHHVTTKLTVEYLHSTSTIQHYHT